MLSFFFLYMSLISHLIKCGKGFIEVKYRSRDDGFYISANIGSPFEYLFLPIDISSDYTWITTKYFNVTKSNTCKLVQSNHELIINKTSFYPKNEVIDTFALSQGYKQALEGFHLYLIQSDLESNTDNLKGAFGFSMTSFNALFSIMDLHKNNGLIANRVLSLENSRYNDGILYLGRISNKVKSDKNKSYCKANDQNDKRWNCKLDSVHINNTNIVYINTFPLFFDTIIPHIKAPKDFIDFLWGKSFFPSECNNGTEADDSISCVCSSISSVNGFSLKIGDFSHEFRVKDLFKRTYKHCQFNIKPNREGNEWILGIAFIRRYNTSFDYDNKKISFYSIDRVSDYGNPYVVAMSSHKGLILSIVMIALIIIGLGWLVTATNRRKKKKLTQIRENIDNIEQSKREYCLNEIRTKIK